MSRNRTDQKKQATEEAPDIRSIVAGAALILVLALVVYLPAMTNGYIWDDDDYVTNNATLRTTQGLADIWLKPSATPQYYPLVHTSFWIEYHLWNLAPPGYHLDNVILHALGAVLLWFVLRRLSVPGAWLAAAVFAVHPVHVESVAWVTERKNVLSGVFYMASALVFLSFAGIGSKEHKPGTVRRYAASLLLFICALLSKSVTATLPVALALVVWWKKDRLTRWDALRLLPYLLIGATSGVITSTLERNQVGAFGKEWDLTFIDRALVAGRALWFYAVKLVWPSNLTFIYPRWEVDSGSAVQYLYPVLALAVIAALWLWRKSLGKSAFVGVAFFAVTLLPALGFVNVYPMRYSWVADHFQYLASIGMISVATGALAIGLNHISRQWNASARRVLGVTAPVLILVALGTLTWSQTHSYNDEETLWRDTIDRNPSAWIAHVNLSQILNEKGDYTAAERAARKAIRLKHDLPEAHDNLGAALGGLGDLDAAIEEHRAAIDLAPGFKSPYVNLAVQLARRGRPDLAVEQCENALRIDPHDFAAHSTLGKILGMLGRPEDAEQELRTALRIRPDSADAMHTLAIALTELGQLDEATEHLRKVLLVQPEDADAHQNLARALYLRGDYEEAWRELHLSADYGGEPPGWLADLARKMPDPGK